MPYTNIDKPEDYFNTLIWTGNGSRPANITGVGFQPDFVWAKSRSNAYHHNLYDSSRGAGAEKELVTNSTQAEGGTNNDEYGYLTSFNSDGFSSTDTNFNAYFNQNSVTYVAWNWKANGGTTASNTDGGITSTVQANTDAGFSIVTYTGTGLASTVGHGLGVAPKVVIVKARTGVPTSWAVFHKDGSTSDDDTFVLNSTAAKATYAGFWNNQYPSSSVFGISNDIWLNNNGVNYVAYCFAEKQGYSKFGSYKANANADGPFVYTGFKPAVVINKRADQGGPWTIFDNGRCPNNVNNAKLSPDTNGAEITTTGDPIDFLSNGYKLRGSGGDCNASGGTYIYMAFAENPFTTSTGIPTTAR